MGWWGEILFTVAVKLGLKFDWIVCLDEVVEALDHLHRVMTIFASLCKLLRVVAAWRLVFGDWYVWFEAAIGRHRDLQRVYVQFDRIVTVICVVNIHLSVLRLIIAIIIIIIVIVSIQVHRIYNMIQIEVVT